ncbi:putative PurR-regulated permease PerM [Fodinibius salinus]|uniref:Putative PurR-regulated permease PerM n=1 Tax=Fodinibius salinus TaxID=860790 RepID=A0A5D3YR04_9BACT|nr:AI-2E family transporter [Fodinibius salinus]TYP95529.1 putative PurR-regulated permease PerM [Fodinibius salinus]
MEKSTFAKRILIRLLLAFSIIAALIITRQLLVPLFLSILFAYLLFPAAQKFENKGLPRILTNFILVGGSFLLVIGFSYGISLLVVTFTENLPDIQEQINTNITHFRWALGRTFGVTAEQLDSIVESIKGSGQYIKQFFTGTANTILTIGLIPVYTFLLLFYRNKFRTFISMLVPDERKQEAQNIIDQAAEVVPSYLKGLFLVCLILIGLNSLGFYIIGVKYALLLGLIAAIFNLIPYLGTIIGYGIALLFVLATQSLSVALLVIVQFFIVQFIENNILTPNITGSYVRINPLVTILSLIAGGMIWGLPGMFMVIPYLAMLKIVCKNIESLNHINYLLGTKGTEDHSLTFQSFRNVFNKKA